MSTKQRFFKYVGERAFSRLPQGPIDQDAYQALPADLRHIVLHSGDWEPMTGEEIKQCKADVAAAEKKAAEEAGAAEKRAIGASKAEEVS